MPEQSITIRVSHNCGHEIKQTTQTDYYDVTSISDIPEHMRPTFVAGVGYIGGVSFENLPLAYHKFIPLPPRVLWRDENGEGIVECPACHKYLEAKDLS
jgi:hypothetical protein